MPYSGKADCTLPHHQPKYCVKIPKQPLWVSRGCLKSAIRTKFTFFVRIWGPEMRHILSKLSDCPYSFLTRIANCARIPVWKKSYALVVVTNSNQITKMIPLLAFVLLVWKTKKIQKLVILIVIYFRMKG
jgi:hypothetical protein